MHVSHCTWWKWVVSFPSEWLCPRAKNPWCLLNRSLIGTQRHSEHFGVGKNLLILDSGWTVMARGDAREVKWRGNMWVESVASSLHTTSEHGVSSITTIDTHTLAASIQLNWYPPANLNGLVYFAERRNLVSAHVPLHFIWPLPRIEQWFLSATPRLDTIPAALSWPLSWDGYLCCLEHSTLTFIILTNLKYFCFLK